MPKSRYWKLTPGEVSGFSYDAERLLNWDIKCVRPPEEDAKFVGVFMYKSGTPLDYDSIRGIAYYHNHIPQHEIPKITGLLREKFGGEEIQRGDRVFLKGSREVYSGAEIGRLAGELEVALGAAATITLEFSDLTQQERDEAGLPDAKLLPIPGK